MKFIVSKTYQVITNESASHGDFAESGFIFEDQEMTLSELKSLIKHEYFYVERCGKKRVCDWMETEPELNLQDGSYTTECLHFYMA